ncbi:hypothetical protein Athai_47670 [Actinocatenispora thailandica]|uniref:DUF4303 domain-containing protein n=1 Tax=Actinocatenispora thailandica TaxID=227318 RepID=A0A7R7HZE2_9ACTN|nr:hypothetical protein [Actinocatenispora thailandica]BCJ37264.1 hypothetical protein Athai_47670 [Actinocatenispora thailandica]
MDWDAFETAWHDSGCRALAGIAAAHPDQPLYAAAFHLCYLDGTEILPPALATNTDTAVHQRYGYSTRFVPPEWRWPVLESASEQLRPWYRRLSDQYLAPAADDGQRDAAMAALEAAHDAALARVCRAITATARRGAIHDALPPSFVAVVLDGEREDEQADLIRASVAAPVLATVPDLVSYLRELDEG